MGSRTRDQMACVWVVCALVVGACGAAEADPPADPPVLETTSIAAKAGRATTTAPPSTSSVTSESTTSVAPPTDPTDAPKGDSGSSSDAVGFHRSVGVIGCSQTRDAVFGYNVVADDGLFGADAEAEYLSAGSIEVWADPPRKKWATFADLVGPDTDAVWIMLCWHVRNSADVGVDEVAVIVAEARRLVGSDVPVYLSGLNDWDPRSLCRKADWEASWALTEAAVAAGLGLRGPDLGPIAESETRDGCHGNDMGNRVMGEQLAAFFGR